MARKDTLVAERIRLDSGGYDSRGRYWGTGEPLFRVVDTDGDFDDHIRAKTAKAAKAFARKHMQAGGPQNAYSSKTGQVPVHHVQGITIYSERSHPVELLHAADLARQNRVREVAIRYGAAFTTGGRRLGSV